MTAPDRMKLIYNGATGGLGQYLGEIAVDNGLDAYAIRSRVHDVGGLREELARLPPAHTVTFVHLAGLVSVTACESDPDLAYSINVEGARWTLETMYEWAAAHGVSLRPVYVSSGHVYAAKPSNMTTSELDAIQPRSVYARTKLAAEEELHELASRLGAPLEVARVFGLLAPRQKPWFVFPSLIRRAVEDRLSDIPGLDAVRDYLDARDICRGLLLLASSGGQGTTTTNLCSGTPVSIRDLLAAILSELDPERGPQRAELARSGPSRPDDVPWLVGDPSRFIRRTGQLPRTIPLSRTVHEAVAAARK